MDIPGVSRDSSERCYRVHPVCVPSRVPDVGAATAAYPSSVHGSVPLPIGSCTVGEARLVRGLRGQGLGGGRSSVARAGFRGVEGLGGLGFRVFRV